MLPMDLGFFMAGRCYMPCMGSMSSRFFSSCTVASGILGMPTETLGVVSRLLEVLGPLQRSLGLTCSCFGTASCDRSTC